jgi:hypothetical protein
MRLRQLEIAALVAGISGTQIGKRNKNESP